MTKFIAELNELTSGGFIYDSLSISVKIFAISCDAPARAFLRSVRVIMAILDVRGALKKAHL